MLVQEIPKPSSAPPKRAPRGSALYTRAALDSTAQQTRVARHLAELEQDNYHAIQIDIPKPERTLQIEVLLILEPRKQHKITPNVRKLLTTRKTFTNLLDEAGFAADVYRDAAVKQGRYPSRTFCSVCGYWGKYGCTRCGERYCSETCGDTHRGTQPFCKSLLISRNEMHEVLLRPRREVFYQMIPELFEFENNMIENYLQHCYMLCIIPNKPGYLKIQHHH